MGIYFDYAYTFDSLTLAVPFCFAILVFYVIYWAFYRSYSERIRTKKMVAR